MYIYSEILPAIIGLFLHLLRVNSTAIKQEKCQHSIDFKRMTMDGEHKL